MIGIPGPFVNREVFAELFPFPYHPYSCAARGAAPSGLPLLLARRRERAKGLLVEKSQSIQINIY
jgi:hypothetical protein